MKLPIQHQMFNSVYLWWYLYLNITKRSMMVLVCFTRFRNKLIRFHCSSVNQCWTTWNRKTTQNKTDPISTIIPAQTDEVNALCTNECHNQTHVIAQADPNMPPTTTWLIVCSRCDTRSHVCRSLKPIKFLT